MVLIKFGDFMAVAYAKLYEIIAKYIKDEKRAEELYNAVVEVIKEEKIIIKHELKDELKNELATKEDILLAEERILRYVDNRFNQLDKKMTVGFVILILLYMLTNPNAIEIIKLLFGVK